jgi:hypothetical protein
MSHNFLTDGIAQLHVLLDWIEATVNAAKASADDGILFQYDDGKEDVPAKKVKSYISQGVRSSSKLH